MLQEIKEAVKKEKENDNRGSSDSDLIDIDTFFVTEYVQNVLEMFGQIEERLKDGWDLRIKALEQYKEREGDCLVPQKHVEILDDVKLNLGKWVSNIRQAKKGENKYLLTPKKIKQLDELGFVWRSESMFDKFYRHALIYKERYGHINIMKNDKIDGYNIGKIYNSLLGYYKKEKLSDEQITKLIEIGINMYVGKYEQQFQRKMNLARQAVNEGVIITKKNNEYKNVNFYTWYRSNKDKFTSSELAIMNKLIPNNHTRNVAIIDLKNGNVKTFSSVSEAGRALYNDFHLVNTEKTSVASIYNYLSGHTKNPIYKGRFRFEYAEDQKPLKEKSPTIKKVSS